MAGLSTASQPRDDNDHHGAADHQSNKPAVLMACSRSNDPQHGHHREHDDAPRVSDVHQCSRSRSGLCLPPGSCDGPGSVTTAYPSADRPITVRHLTWMLTQAPLPRPPDRCRGLPSGGASSLMPLTKPPAPSCAMSGGSPPGPGNQAEQRRIWHGSGTRRGRRLMKIISGYRNARSDLRRRVGAPSATRTRDLLLRRHSRMSAVQTCGFAGRHRAKLALAVAV
jgi:hypothetical protein